MDDFELEFQRFIELGGFKQPTIREDLERTRRGTIKKTPELCPHGMSPLSCSKCYFEK